MSATATKPATSQPQVLAAYCCDEGTRQLVAQRIHGTVAVSDVPLHAGRVYLVERDIPSQAELEALAADYTGLAAQLGRPPLREDWVLGTS